MNFKKLLLSLALFASPCSYAAEQAIGGKWSGLNNGDASILIGDNEAQDLSNVDLTETGAGVRKRGGYDEFRTIGISTWAVRGGYNFRNSSAADLVIHANSRSVFKSANSGAYAAFLTTATNGSYWDFTDSLGYLYGANNNNDELWRSDGTTLTYFPNHPKGDQVEFTSNRFVISGTTTNPKRVTFCEESTPTNCTVGGTAETDPFHEDMDMPGQRNTAINYACGGVEVWTKEAMSLITAQDQYDKSQTEIISKTIGTIQPYSVVDDLGVTYWQGTDKHFYSYDCNVISKISSKLDVSNIVSGEAKSWTVTSQSDFESGTVGNGLSTTYSVGDVAFSTIGVLHDDFADGDYTSAPAWTQSLDSATVTTSISGGKFQFQGTGVSESNAAGDIYGSTTAFNTGFVIAKYKPTAEISANVGMGRIIISTTSATAAPPTGYGVYLSATNSPSNNQIQEWASGSVSAILGFFTYSFGTGTEYEIKLQRDNDGKLTVFVDGAEVKNVTDTTYTSFSSVHLGMPGNTTATAGTRTSQFDDVRFSTGTALYTSPAFNIGSAITAYGPFDVNNVLNGGSIAFTIYGHNASNISTSVFTSSQTITPGSVPSFAVQPYALWTANFTRTLSTQTPTLNDVTVNWTDGSITRHWGSVDKDHRIIWSVAEGTATVPNVSYIYDPRFDAWLKYSFPMEAPARVGDSLYFGGVSTGVVYAWPSGNTDNGSAITAFWKSKDFVAPDPFVEKDYMGYSLVTKAQTGSNLDLIYTINTSSSVTNNYSLTDSNGNSFRRINANLPSGRFGTFINFRFGNDDGDAPFEVYALKYDYRPRPWRVLP